jgi:hypothetical protein
MRNKHPEVAELLKSKGAIVEKAIDSSPDDDKK